jgi:iron complex outermembrane recepter protein
MKKKFSRSAISTALLSLNLSGSLTVWAQNSPPDGATPTLKEVVITGNPLNANDLVQPTVQYSGMGLALRSQTTLGETLNTTPGVSSTYFGPNASRPIIRGLDGDRIRILGNGSANMDVSGLSYDHAVAMDPLSVERIEVLRGPGALLYGGNAVGGVVNVIDNRIPREAMFDAKGGITGKANVGLSSANRGKDGSFLLEGGTDRYALHADGFKRKTKNLRVPVALSCTQGDATTVSKQICNSASDSEGGAVGGSIFFDKGYLGASTSRYNNTYGTVAEDEVTIRMRSQQHALAGEIRDLNGFIQSIKGQWSYTDYRHTEFDAETPATTFKNKGNDLRLEARHAKFGRLDGVIGLQTENTKFSADGAEAFAPYSNTRQKALFAYEELGMPWGRFSFGGRWESVSVDSSGSPLTSRFFVGNRNFKPKSYALGTLVNLNSQWQVTSNLSWSGRAPKYYELYADGPHAATGTYEVGDPTFRTEKSVNLDAGVQWKSGAHRFGLTAFVNRFKNYISLESTGSTRDTDGNGAAGLGVTDCGDGSSVESGCAAEILPEYAYRQVRARFTGFEASGNVRLLGNASTLDLELRGDLVRAANRNTGEPLPRIAPVRLGATLVWSQGPWSARLGFDRTAAQNRVPVGQLSTAGYTLWNAAMTYRMKAGASNLMWFAKLENIGNALGYSATSILTQTAPGKAPLPGRNLKLGLQMSF